MTFVVQRFDLDQTPRTSNTPRQTPEGSLLPVGFPFVIDYETGELAEPVLLHLAGKFNAADCYARGAWVKRRSADAAAADLKAWWITLKVKDRGWDDVDDQFLSLYLRDLRTRLSPATKDFLSDATVNRRFASISEFYRDAALRHDLAKVPSCANAKILVRQHGGRAAAWIAQTDAEPHPMEIDDLNAIAVELGPEPLAAKKGQFSRDRLAFEIAVQTGMRIDEILNLRAATFEHIEIDDDLDMSFELLLRHTKGLRKRTVYFAHRLVREIQCYISGERKRAITQAEGTWLRDKRNAAPTKLLLNREDAGPNAGKVVRAATIEAAFNLALASLPVPLIREKLVAEGTKHERLVVVPKHVFHDCRHTYAHELYLSQVGRHSDPIRVVQIHLGHRSKDVTEGVYLDVFEALSSEGLRLANKSMRENRNYRGRRK